MQRQRIFRFIILSVYVCYLKFVVNDIHHKIFMEKETMIVAINEIQLKYYVRMKFTTRKVFIMEIYTPLFKKT